MAQKKIDNQDSFSFAEGPENFQHWQVSLQGAS
jgi:hypothetical protein